VAGASKGAGSHILTTRFRSGPRKRSRLLRRPGDAAQRLRAAIFIDEHEYAFCFSTNWGRCCAMPTLRFDAEQSSLWNARHEALRHSVSYIVYMVARCLMKAVRQ
jgi:hypothetical protein